MPYIGTSPSNGVRRVHTYTATASQTTFSGASSEGVTLSYVDTNYLDVFQNGVLLGSADYTSTSGTSVVLAQGASVDDLIVIVVYDVFSVADTVSKTNGGSFDSAVTMSNNLTVSGAFTSQGIDDNADATAITIDSSENVGIGTTSPVSDAKLTISSDNTESNIFLERSGSGRFDVAIANTSGSLAFKGGSNQTTVAGLTEFMRIDGDSGSLLINNTGASPLNNGRVRIYNDTAQDAVKTYQATSGTTALWSRIDHTASYFAVFNYNGSTVGTITTNGSATAYNTSSDYRLKENVTADWNATTRLKQLNPVRFNFIADADTTVDGFLAHEVQTIVPEAITGTHNELEVWKDGEELPNGVSVGDNKLDDDGNTIPKYQGIDQSKLVPLLVKTIQELEARITALENAE